MFCTVTTECQRDAAVIVYYYDDGSGAVHACKRHIATAIGIVLSRPTVASYAIAKVRPIDKFREEIMAIESVI